MIGQQRLQVDEVVASLVERLQNISKNGQCRHACFLQMCRVVKQNSFNPFQIQLNRRQLNDHQTQEIQKSVQKNVLKQRVFSVSLPL